MNLEQIFPDFISMAPNEMETFFAAYHDRRAADLLSESRFAKKTAKKPVDSLKSKLSPEELLMMKKLGLKMKDVASLTSSLDDEEDAAGPEEEDNVIEEED